MSKLILLVGPSGSGKTMLQNMLSGGKYAEAVPTYTTRKPRACEENGSSSYTFVSHDEWEGLESQEFFLEHDVYAGEHYGTAYEDIDRLLQTGNVVKAITVNGAKVAKEKYGNRCIICAVIRKPEDLVRVILRRNTSEEEKITRICSMQAEREEAQGIADVILRNTGSEEDLLEEVLTKVSFSEETGLVTVKTGLGTLKAFANDDPDYPGIKVCLDDKPVALVETTTGISEVSGTLTTYCWDLGKYGIQHGRVLEQTGKN